MRVILYPRSLIVGFDVIIVDDVRATANGGVPERFIGAVLKTVVRDERTVGSNPTSS